MRNSYKNIENRREHILDVLNKNKSMTIEELSKHLNVSEMTIRRDCNSLAKMGRITQHLGTVSFVSPDNASNSDSRYRIKRSLGMEAAKNISDHVIDFINSSTTALYADQA